MSHGAFTWSDEAPQIPPSATGQDRFAWSDEQKRELPPNAGLAPVSGAPGSFPFEEDQPSAGKLQGLPGVHPHTPTFREGKSDLMLAATPLAATMSVPRIIGSVVGGYAGNAGGKFLARTAGGGDTAQEISGDVGGLIGGGIGAHRLGNGINGFRAPIADALRPEPTFPGAPLPASPPSGEFVEAPFSRTKAGPSIAHAEVVQPKLLPESASVSRDLPYRMGLGEIAPEDVSAPNKNILAGRQGVRIAPPGPQTPQRLLSPGTAGQMVESVAPPAPQSRSVSSPIERPALIAPPNLQRPTSENPTVGNFVRAMDKAGLPIAERPSLVLKGSGRISRILGPKEDLTGIMAKSVRLAKRQRGQ